MNYLRMTKCDIVPIGTPIMFTSISIYLTFIFLRSSRRVVFLYCYFKSEIKDVTDHHIQKLIIIHAFHSSTVMFF